MREELLSLAEKMRCVNAHAVGRSLGVDKSAAAYLLERLFREGLLRRFKIGGLAVVYCVPEAEPGEAASALLRIYGIEERRFLERLREALRKARGRRLCLSPSSLAGRPDHRGATRAALAYLTSLLGSDVVRTGGRPRLCVDVEEALERLGGPAAAVEDGRVDVAVKLPRALAEALERLARGGRSADDVVAEALAVAVERYRGLAPARGRAEKTAARVYVEPEVLRGLEELVRRGIYVSVGEAVREAVRLFLASRGNRGRAPRGQV